MLSFDKYYHIYNHANGDDNLFREGKNYEYFLRKYQQHISPIADTIAWCLMPNHFHLLVKIKSEEEVGLTFPKFQTLEKLENRSHFLSKQFSNFFSSYTQSYNKLYGRYGSLFIKNFKRKEITSKNYFRNLVIYIHLNPLKHGFTEDVTSWKWCSYEFFPINNQAIFRGLFEDTENYRYLHTNLFPEYDSLESELT